MTSLGLPYGGPFFFTLNQFKHLKTSVMKELMILSLVAVPVERIIEDLKDACYNYDEDPSEENFNGIASYCQCLLTKRIVGDDIKKAVELIKDLDKTERATELLTTELN